MGMFDDIRCKYPLPISGANDLVYQTKDTPEQMLDMYEIREDGTLWHEAYDIEDHSEAGKWMKQNPGKEIPEKLKGFYSLCGCMTRVNKRMEPYTAFKTGEIVFYARINETGWIEWSAYFENGKVSRLNLLEHREK